MGKNPSFYKGDARMPVDSVSWDDAKEFCAKFSAKYGVTARLHADSGPLSPLADAIRTAGKGVEQEIIDTRPAV